MEGLGIGRIVHYVNLNGGHRAAIVTKVYEGSVNGLVNLTVFKDPSSDSGNETLETRTSVGYSTIPDLGTWHWPELV